MTMNNETPPIDLAHLKALYDSIEQKVISKDIDFHVSSEEGDRITDFWVTLHNAFPQLCRELEAERQRNGPVGHTKAEMRKAEESLRLATMRADSLQSQLSKAEDERDRMRKAIEQGLESLRAFIQDSSDPGTGALSAEYMMSQALLSAQPLPQTEGREVWQPISTAPRGKKLIASYVNPYGNRRVVMARYYEKDTLELADYLGEGYAPEGWYEESETHEDILTIECPPDLWTPLPPALVSEKGPVDSPEGLRPRIEK
jgi:hypothetical protein